MTNRKNLIFGFTLIFLVSAALCVGVSLNFAYGNAEKTVATFYSTNDVHGGFGNSIKDNGECYAAAAALKKAGNEKGTPTYLVDAGDHSDGSTYTIYDQGHTAIQAMKSAYYDFAVPGNHEFTYTVDVFNSNKAYAAQEVEGLGTYNYYACNFFNLDPNTGQHSSQILDSYKMLDVKTDNGILKIALVGIMTPETISTNPLFFQNSDGKYIYGVDSANSEAITEPLFDTVQQNVNNAKENGANLVIGVSHLGIGTDVGFNSSAYLLNTVSGFDGYIDGHSHSISTDSINNVPYVQTGTGFQNIGKLEVIQNADGTYKIETSLIPGDTYSGPYDEATKQIESSWVSYINQQFDDDIAYAPNYFYFNDDEELEKPVRIIRSKETNLGDICSDSLYWYANEFVGNCDCAIVNAGAIRKCLAPGVIKYLNVNEVMPFTNHMCVATMTGDTLREALEYGVMYYGIKENAKLMQSSGIMLKVNTDIESSVVEDDGQWAAPPTGNYRIEQIKIYNKETAHWDNLELDKYYTVCGSSYHFKFYGDGFNMFRRPDVTYQDLGIMADQILKQYCSAFKSEENAIPTLKSENSPLAAYKNFALNYESKYGANRFGAYTLSFNTDGGTEIEDQYLGIDSPTFAPKINPVKEGFLFDNWYDNQEFENVYAFGNTLNEDTTVYAKWNANPVVPPKDNPAVNSGGAPQTSDYLWIMLTIFAVGCIVTFSIYYYKKKAN